ncbi:MAG TPA: 16S rRNA (adenine(1518)-N(6)/adenine(1519)-N(6))-dimethyltransferase RsmA [Steroidobacteraceae bacterium]|nr:16S rRNA (adenine(1518)-N(6)/adenine(1519)-N(6))-dimethyltransferase RsmA [Steroidobacteraceae bacterium]
MRAALPPRRKRFGQHFLHDPAVIERIATAIGAARDDCLVEIGPGRGALTRLLLSSGGPLDAIEIDRDLSALLRTELGHEPRFHLHEADALEFDFRELARARGRRLRIIGNLPYNISTPLLFHLLDSGEVIEDLHVMLQKEVVMRLAAGAGDPDYGRLSVMLAPWTQVERLFDVGPGAFQPPPRVWSAVVRLRILATPAFPVSPHFGTVVAAAFTHRRKTVRNALREILTLEQIHGAGVDPLARPETLPPEAFNALAEQIATAAAC